MSDGKSMDDRLEELRKTVKQMEEDRKTRTTRITVNKRTHRMRFEDETEDSLTVVVEPHEKQGEGK